jgi:hypothetical protein
MFAAGATDQRDLTPPVFEHAMLLRDTQKILPNITE